MNVASYMGLCNAHYYATRDPLGAAGDFTTSPEISQIFGELLGVWVIDYWQRTCGRKAVFCELGPGRGTLMNDMLRATRADKAFHDAIDVWMVETSPILMKAQKQTLKDAHARISWHKALDKLPSLPLFLIANEFFDALPIQQFLKTETGWQERMIDVSGDQLLWKPEGKVIAEASPDSADIMARIATHIHAYGGAALVIDYGHNGGQQGDTLQAVHKHAYAKPLGTPGEVDLTAHVDFGALLHTAKGRGAQCWGEVEQGTFLKRLGAELRAQALCRNADSDQQKMILSGLERMVAPHEMGALFKVIAVTASPETPAGF